MSPNNADIEVLDDMSPNNADNVTSNNKEMAYMGPQITCRVPQMTWPQMGLDDMQSFSDDMAQIAYTSDMQTSDDIGDLR
ncbi:hypothetical protein TNCV_397731 [Trichonephila clavipes]|nr:hypothetical protein TNCV_397731 [Trichonephila clavipes]